MDECAEEECLEKAGLQRPIFLCTNEVAEFASRLSKGSARNVCETLRDIFEGKSNDFF
jgi:hypothetical protein